MFRLNFKEHLIGNHSAISIYSPCIPLHSLEGRWLFPGQRGTHSLFPLAFSSHEEQRKWMGLPLNLNPFSQRPEKFWVDSRGIWLDFVFFKDRLFKYIYISFQMLAQGKSKPKFVFCSRSCHFHIIFISFRRKIKCAGTSKNIPFLFQPILKIL